MYSPEKADDEKCAQKKSDKASTTTTRRHRATSLPREPPGPDKASMDAMRLFFEESFDRFAEKWERKFNDFTETVRRDLSGSVSALQSASEEHAVRLSSLENADASTQIEISGMNKKIADLERTVQNLTDKCADLESRGRRKNVRVIGLPEGSESSPQHQFASKFLQDLLGLEKAPSVERSHRGLRVSGDQDARPRHYLIRLQTFRDRELVMQRARDAGELRYREHKILIFPDLAPIHAKRRADYAAIKKRLRKDRPDCSFSMQYPSKLRVTFKSGDHRLFQNPQEVADFLNLTE